MNYNFNRLAYQTPTTEQRNIYEQVNTEYQLLVERLLPLLPDSADSTAALRAIEDSRMKVNLAIALEKHPMRVDGLNNLASK